MLGNGLAERETFLRSQCMRMVLSMCVRVLIKCCKRELIELNELENAVGAAMPKSTN